MAGPEQLFCGCLMRIPEYWFYGRNVGSSKVSIDLVGTRGVGLKSTDFLRMLLTMSLFDDDKDEAPMN
jgi:hypothetical protein